MKRHSDSFISPINVQPNTCIIDFPPETLIEIVHFWEYSK